jgi:hypothetical protein
MKPLHINFLFSSRYFVMPISLSMFVNLKESSKQKIHVNLIACQNTEQEHAYVQQLLKHGISANLVWNNGGDYMEKIQYAANEPSRYSIKMDSDVWCSWETLDYWIENIEFLDEKDVITLSPISSSGIPSVDWYVDRLFPRAKRDEIYNLFKKIRFPADMNGADYTSLNKYTVDNPGEWNPDEFNEGVCALNHYYKGIHPMRMSKEAQCKINDYTIEHIEDFFEPKNLSIFKSNRHYLCPQFNSMRTELWREIINRKDLFMDAWDEVPIALYSQQNKLKHCFIDNGFSQHIIYTWVGDRNYEYHYANRFLEKMQQVYG